MSPADAIINGFGISLGDSIIGLQALRIAQGHGLIVPRPVLYRRPGVPAMTEAFYALAADFADPRPFPLGLAPERDAQVPDALAGAIDIRDFAFDPAFRGVAMIDYFLRQLGIDAATVPSAEKRNDWLRPRVQLPAPVGDAYALICPNASMPTRNMPGVVLARVLDWLATHTRLMPLTAPTDLPTPEALCGLVAHATLVVSTDTAMVHLADAFDRPCLAVFTTHRPEWRARDYPYCITIHRKVAGLPEALEFARGPEDARAAQAAWIDPGRNTDWIEQPLQKLVQMSA